MTKVVILLGPTAVGKTEISIILSNKINNIEIISADSRQVYKYLTIGTNKPQGKWENISGENVFIYKDVPYHLVDFIEPQQQYDAGSFYNDASNLIEKITKKNKLPLIVGGTGLYIKTITDGISILPKRNENIRKNLLNLVRLYGRQYLYTMLSNLDPERAVEIHPNNIHRILRSLEIIIQTGQPFSKVVKNSLKTISYECLLIGLYMKKFSLLERVIARTKQMLNSGIIEETKQLLTRGISPTSPGFSSIGYKWVIKFLQKEISFELLQENIIKDTMAYIKRQITWFKKDNRIIWIECDELKLNAIVEKIYTKICKFLR